MFSPSIAELFYLSFASKQQPPVINLLQKAKNRTPTDKYAPRKISNLFFDFMIILPLSCASIIILPLYKIDGSIIPLL